MQVLCVCREIISLALGHNEYFSLCARAQKRIIIQLTTGESSEMREEHPVRGAEEHPPLDVVESGFGSGKPQPQKPGQYSQSYRLQPVQTRQHARFRLLKISLR